MLRLCLRKSFWFKPERGGTIDNVFGVGGVAFLIHLAGGNVVVETLTTRPVGLTRSVLAVQRIHGLEALGGEVLSSHVLEVDLIGDGELLVVDNFDGVGGKARSHGGDNQNTL